MIAPILDMLFPPGSSSRIPIAVVTGVGDTRSVACMLADLLAADGSTVGLAADNGVFIHGRRVDGGGVNGPAATRMLLLDPAVQVAVIEMPLSDALLHRPGYDWADSCAIVNDQPIQSPDLIRALSAVVGSARSHVVMAPGDQETYGLKLHPQARACHVNADGPAPAVLQATALALCLGRQRGDIERRLASRSQDHVQ